MSMTTCPRCGKPKKPKFELCYDCHVIRRDLEDYHRYQELSEDEKQAEREAYWSTECDMCGKEGASPHSDGKNYCGTCWTIWNS